MNALFIFVMIPVLILLSIVPILVGVYVYRDAKRRKMNAALWTLIAVVAPGLIGFIVYLLARGNYPMLECAQCGAPVTEQYAVCPKCGVKLHAACPNCAKPVEPDWQVCPHCAAPLPAGQTDVVTPRRREDKTLWKILAAVIILPILLIGLLMLSVTVYSGGLL